MNISSIIIVSFVILIIGFLVIKTIHNRRQDRIRLELLIKENYGRKRCSKDFVNDDVLKSYKFSEFGESTANLEKKSYYQLDEQTKKDINFNSMFSSINHTYSSLGEEYLYNLLSNPSLDENVLLERESRVNYLQIHRDIAMQLQYFIAPIGKGNKVSLYKYIEFLQTLDVTSLWLHSVALGMFTLSVVLAIVLPKLGVVPFLVVIGINLVTYWNDRLHAQSIMDSIKSLEYMIQASIHISNMDNKIVNYYSSSLSLGREYRKIFKNANWIMANDSYGQGDMGAIISYIRMLTHIDYVKLRKIVKQIQGKKTELSVLAEGIGSLESDIAIASFRESLQYYCLPLFYDKQDKSLSLHIRDGYHPLINEPIANSIEADCCVLLTGTNASGKSTFLRMILINALLAQTIHTCLAKEYEAQLFILRSSMSVSDNVERKESYFIAELNSLKEILDVQGETPILCIVDELLRGTNTIERVAASTEVLRYMANNNILCLAATHDIELAELLSGEYNMYHFQEYISKDKVYFDYQLYDGWVTTKNAIRLLEMKGFDQSIINKANSLVNQFERTGTWK